MAKQIQPDWATWSSKEYLAKASVTLRGRSFVSAVGEGTVTISGLDGGCDVEVPATAVVHVTFHETNPELGEALAAVAGEVRVIGEARTQRFLTASIRDGYEAGRVL